MKTKGFTLIELVITIAILGLLMALSIQTMFGVVTNNKVQAAGSRVFSFIQGAKADAVKRNESLAVTISQGSLFITNQSGSYTKTMPIDLDAVVSSSTFSFDSMGSIVGGVDAPPVRVTPKRGVCSDEVKCYEVRVYSAGFVKLCDPYMGDSHAPTYCVQ